MDAKPETCVDCGKTSPKTETNYTLISPRYGWRLVREKNVDGKYDVKWRCPECWRALKVPDKVPPHKARPEKGA